MSSEFRHTAVSLFSNCGAGDVGYKNAGFEFEVMAELDARRLDVCLLNHPEAHGVPDDLRETWPQVIEKYRERSGSTPPALLSACPPCQGMSSARSNRGLADDADAGSKDTRNLLVEVIAKVANELQPKITVVENVPAFFTRKVRHPDTLEPISAANLLISRLAENYTVFPLLTDLCDYGVPQTRKRAFLTFIKNDVPGLARLLKGGNVPFPIPTHSVDYGGEPIDVITALRGMALPPLDAECRESAKSENPMHFVPVWGTRQYAMVAAIPPNSGAGAWENQSCFYCGKVEVLIDDISCPKCSSPLLRPVVPDNNGGYRFIKGFRNSSYRRMIPNRPASTVTTASGHIGSDFTIHPFENRLLSSLECAKIQTFPDNFKWGDALKKWGHTNVRAMIGEAVPPLFTELHGTVLINVLRKSLDGKILSASDTRHTSANRNLKRQYVSKSRTGRDLV